MVSLTVVFILGLLSVPSSALRISDHGFGRLEVTSPVPTFAIRTFFPEGAGSADLKDPVIRTFKEMFVDPLQSHAAATEEDSADISLVCCLHCQLPGCSGNKAKGTQWSAILESKFKTLPLRSPSRPYVVFAYGMEFDKAKNFLVGRNDTLLMHFDPEEQFRAAYKFHAGKMGMTSPAKLGVTLPVPTFFRGEPGDVERPRKYFLTFRGAMDSDIREAVSKVSEKIARKDIVLEFLPGDIRHRQDVVLSGPNAQQKAGAARYSELMNTTYALILNGVGRYTARFSDAIGACAIPVLIDSRTPLPYEDQIDWSTATINLGEKLGMKSATDDMVAKRLLEHPEAIYEHLPSDDATVRQMRNKVCAINEQYFATPTKRAEAALRSAAMLSNPL